MITLRRILIGVALSVMASGLASASSIIQTFTLNNTNTDITGTVGSGTFDDFLAICPTCNASWLTGVTLEISVNENLNSLSVTNTASNPNTFEYVTYSNLSIVGTAPSGDKGALGGDLFGNAAASFPSSAGGCQPTSADGEINLCDTGNVTYASGQTIVYAPPGVTQNDDSGVQSASNIALYDTAGTFTLGFTTKTFQSFIGGGGTDTNSQATQANGTVDVIYDYTVPSTGTPEPTTMALMGGALVGLGLLGKRLKKS